MTPDELSEVAIMQAAKHQKQAFAPLYDRYFPRIYAYCRRRVNSDQEAEDLASQIFTRVLMNLNSYRDGRVAAWLFRIAHNTVANYYRDERHTLPIEDAIISSSDPDPIQHVIRQEQYDALQAALVQLTIEKQELINLKMVGQLTAPEIGEIVGKSASAVRTEIHRTMQQLRNLMELSS